MSEEKKIEIDAKNFIDNLEETLVQGRVKRFYTKLSHYQSIKVPIYTYSTVTILNWLKDPVFWSVVDFVYQGLKKWLIGI